MTTSTGNRILKTTSSSIVGCINDFNSRVTNTVYNMAGYYSSNLPKFNATASIGIYGDLSPTVKTYWSYPQAIETAQFTTKTQPSLSITDTRITASTLWANMLSITRTLNRIRYFYANWYNNQYGARVLISQLQGCGVFNPSFPTPTGGSDCGGGGASQFWGRSGTTGVTINPTNAGITSGNRATASTFNNTVTNCYNAWYNSCYTANQLTYTMYTCHVDCHSQCHSNCHDSRSRR